MKKRRLFIWLFVLCAGLPVWGQTGVYGDYPMAQQPELQQTGYEFEAMPSAFVEEHSMPFAAEDLDGLNETYSGPRKILPPVIGGEEEPPATPDFTPIGDVPVLFMLLLAGACVVVVRVRTRE